MPSFVTALRRHFPSMWIPSPSASSHVSSTHSMKMELSRAGAECFQKRRNVSWLGTPFSSFRNPLNQPSFSVAYECMS